MVRSTATRKMVSIRCKHGWELLDIIKVRLFLPTRIFFLPFKMVQAIARTNAARLQARGTLLAVGTESFVKTQEIQKEEVQTRKFIKPNLILLEWI